MIRVKPAEFKLFSGRIDWVPIIAGALLFAISALCLTSFYVNTHARSEAALRQRLLSLATLSASLTDMARHQNLTQPEQMGSPDYEAVRKPYYDILKANDDLIYIYSVIHKDSQYYIVMDAELPRPQEHIVPSNLMDIYAEPSKALKTAMDTRKPTVADKPYTDEFGVFISAYAPLITPKGDFGGVIGVDMSLREYNAIQARLISDLYMSLGLALLLSIGLGGFVWNQRRGRLKADRKYSAMVGNVPVAVFEATFAENLQLTFANAHIETLTGQEARVLKADGGFTGLIHPSDLGATLNGLRQQIMSKGRASVEFRLRLPSRATGSLTNPYRIIWVQMRAEATEVRGDSARLEGFIQDITLRRLVESKLTDGQRQFRRLADGMPSPLWITDQYGDAVFFNKAWLDYTGRSIDDEIEAGWIANIHPVDLDICQTRFGRAQTLLERFDMWFRIKGHDDQYRWMLSVCTPRFDGEGRCDGFVFCATDITERKKLEDELKRHRDDLQSLVTDQTRLIRREADENALLRNIIASANAAQTLDAALSACLTEVSGFTGWQTGHCYLLDSEGRNLEPMPVWTSGSVERHPVLVDWIGSHLLPLQQLDTLPVKACLQGCVQSLNGRDEADISTRAEILTEAGMGGTIVFPITLEGVVIGIFEFFSAEPIALDDELSALLKDIGLQYGQVIARFRREESLRQAMLAAEASARAKSEFLSNMSHELRTPLHAILNYASLSARRAEAMPEGDGRERLQKFLGHIGIAGQRLLGLLNNLLDLARLEAGKMNFAFEAHNLAKAIEHTQTELEPLVRTKNLTLDNRYDPKTLEGRFDMARVIQLLVNLYANAIRFAPEGSVLTLEALRETDTDGRDCFRVQLTDDGVGIAESERDSIFESFTQGADAKSGAGGTGLGLSICRQIVEGHGGRIWAEGAEGRGARLCFRLPVDAQNVDVTPEAERLHG